MQEVTRDDLEQLVNLARDARQRIDTLRRGLAGDSEDQARMRVALQSAEALRLELDRFEQVGLDVAATLDETVAIDGDTDHLSSFQDLVALLDRLRSSLDASRERMDAGT